MADSQVFDELADIIDKMSEREQIDLLEYLRLRPFFEKRMHHRKTYSAALDYSVDDRFYRDFVTDISSTGIFLRTSKEFSPGQKVTMVLPLPDGKGEIKLTGTVARTTRGGMGIRFIFRSKVTEEIFRERLAGIGET